MTCKKLKRQNPKITALYGDIGQRKLFIKLFPIKNFNHNYSN